MLRCHAALRQCVRAISPGTHALSTTRLFLPPCLPCLAQQRTRTWLSRLLGTGFNSVKSKSKSRVGKRTVRRTPKPAIVSPVNASHAPRAEAEPPKNDVSPVQDVLPSTPYISLQKHHDLSTYNKFVAKNKVDTESMTHIGTMYEYVVAEALTTWGMTLHRCGGKDDEGIDLQGSWTPPSTPPREFTVLVQCKFGRPLPAFARELEGAVATSRRRLERKVDAVLALLASPKAITQATWQTIQRSPRPMCFAQVSAEGRIINFLQNAAADSAGFAELAKHSVYVQSSDADGKAKRPRRSVVLSAKDEPWWIDLKSQR